MKSELQRLDEAGEFVTIYLGNLSTFTDDGLFERTTYSYRVRGIDGEEVTPWSNVKTVQTKGAFTLHWSVDSAVRRTFGEERVELAAWALGIFGAKERE